MDACLFFHTGNHLQIDLRYGLSIQHRIQQNIQLQNRLLVQFFADGNQLIANYIPFCYDHRQNLMVIHLRKLNKFQLVLVILRGRDHCGIIRITGQNPYDLLQHLLHLVCALDHQFFQLCDLPLLLLHQMVHIQTIAFVRRNPACRCMRLDDIAHLLQIGHLVADRGGTQS